MEAGPHAAVPDWQSLIRTAATEREVGRRALRHEGGIETATRPQKFTCDDTGLYAVKLWENQHGDGKGVFTEQVVALAGRLIGAPVPQVDLVHVSADLVSGLNLPFDAAAGTHHGSRWVDGYSDRQAIAYVDENRERLGSLDALYAWTYCAGDHQFIYRNSAPHEVLSVDHTTFLPGGPDWTEASLSEAGSPVKDAIFTPLGLQPEHHAAALAKMGSVTPADIARIVARPPDEWGVTEAERIAVAEYLNRRLSETRALFAA